MKNTNTKHTHTHINILHMQLLPFFRNYFLHPHKQPWNHISNEKPHQNVIKC